MTDEGKQICNDFADVLDKYNSGEVAAQELQEAYARMKPHISENDPDFLAWLQHEASRRLASKEKQHAAHD